MGMQITVDEGTADRPPIEVTLTLGSNDPLRAKAFSSLRQLKWLKRVSLYGWGIDDLFLESVQTMPRLEALVLGDTYVGDEGLRRISRITTLKRLSIMENSEITDCGVRRLAKLVNLDELVISDTSKVTGASLIATRRMPKLKTLGLSWSRVSDEGVKAIGSHSSLECLVLTGSLVGDEVAEALQSMPKLREVDLIDTGFTDRGAAALRRARPEMKLEYKRGSRD
jgi:hypothetical protein